MPRLFSLALLLLLASAGQSLGQGSAPPAGGALTTASGNATAQAAMQTYTQLRGEWKQILQTIEQTQASLGPITGDGATGDERAAVERQLGELHRQAGSLLDRIVAAALQVHQADSHNYPKVNSMLVALAQFFVVGDYAGDGGDQYEKALPITQALLATGMANDTPELWLWGGVSAFATGEHALAKEYFVQAENAGLLGNRPPSRNRNDPRNRAWRLGKSFAGIVDTYGDIWQQEQKIRAAEAKADDLPRVLFTTAKGDIVIELFENEAPQAVANFITLVKKGFYDGLTFHRVLPGFMAQGGCPEGTGTGGPGYNIRCECYQPNARKHFRGSLSMAHAGRDTGGSQFFLTFVPTDFLNGRHTVFGRVIEGIEVASAIRRRDPQSPHAAQADKIIKAEVLRDRGHEYKFEKLPGR